jgi:hypothetical protein
MPFDYKPKQNLYSKQVQASSSNFTWDKDPPHLDVLKDHQFDKLREEELVYFILSFNT